MKNTTKLAIAFAAMGSIPASVSWAQDRDGPGRQMRGDRDKAPRFERVDTNGDGSISFEEFAAVMDHGISNADANADGTLTVEEIAKAIEKRRSERAAARIIERFDNDGDGKLTLAEIESRQKKMFALADRNDDGKVEMSEMPRRMMKGERGGRRGGDGPRRKGGRDDG
jgi:hypothetical protein